MPEIIETKVICKQHRRYIGWPTIAVDADGVLHAVFSGDREAHVDPMGKSFYLRSEDDGRSWSEPVVVNDTPLDDRDTGLCVCPDGTLVMTWFTSHYYGRYAILHGWGRQSNKDLQPWEVWRETISKVSKEDAEYWAPHIVRPTANDLVRFQAAGRELGFEPESGSEDARFEMATRRLGFWTRRSYDGGRTWDEPTPSPVSAPHGANLLPDGRLIYIGSTPMRTKTGDRELGVAISSDQGKTWSVKATIPAMPAVEGYEGPTYLTEPHVAAAPSGKLLGMARFEVKDRSRRCLWQFESSDGGATWTEPVPNGVHGFPPHILRLRDDRMLVSYAIRHEPPGQRFCFSNDEGQTWEVDNEVHFPVAPSGDLGYPATAQCQDGTLVTIYYQQEKRDEKPCLMMTRWKA